MTCFDDGECGSCETPCLEAQALALSLDDTQEFEAVTDDDA